MKPSSEADTAAGVGTGTHAFLILTIGMVVGAIAWAAVGRLEVVSTALGEVIPSSQVKTVQHLEGGIVSEIHVREGEAVTPGQPLVSLEPTARDADLGELRLRMAGLRADLARLQAEAGGADVITFPADLGPNAEGLMRETETLFRTRLSRQKAQIDAQESTIAQRKQEIQVIRARLGKQQSSLKLLREQVSISEELLKDDLTNRMLHLNLLKEMTELEGQIREDSAAIRVSESAVTQAEARMVTLHDSYQEEVQKEQEEKRRRLDELETRTAKFEDSLQRTVLRSPVEGIVKTLSVATLGGVVKPGDTVVEVVPAGDQLIIEARLPSQEIGYVQSGQDASVQLASGDAARFGKLDAKVVAVSPDTIDSGEGYAYYRVRLETAFDRFERGGQTYRLVPGVQVVCSIITGERSVLQYLLDPVLGSMQTALRER